MKNWILTILIVGLQIVCYGQSISELQQKKLQTIEKIKYTTQLLNQTQKSEKSSLGKLRLINTKINQRNVLIKNLNQEINLYNELIDNNILAIVLLKSDVELMKDEYAQLIRSTYRNKIINNKILFLLSADNFNQAHRRYLYIKRYVSYRQKQAETIGIIQELLDKKVKRLESQKQKQAELMEAIKSENSELSKEKQQQNNELLRLKNKQRQLRKTLKQHQNEERQLEQTIQRIIEEEARKRREAGGSGFALTPEQKLIGNNFEQNKSRLPWPVERGLITEHFGIHTHPVLKNVQVKNNGINITTEPGAKVRAVFNGEVSRVFGITGGNTAIIIRHGKYLTVYSNLKEVVVKKGDKVATKQVIGSVYIDSNDGNKSVLKFQIWEENNKLNPEKWIVQE